MSEIKSCCCELLPLRTQCIVIAIIGTIIGIVTWGIAIFMTILGLYDDRVIILTSIGVISFALEMAVWICVFLGIFLNNAKLIFAALVELVLIIAIRIGISIFLLTYWKDEPTYDAPNFAAIAGFIGSLIMLIPLIYHVFSFVVICMFYRTLDRKVSLCF